VGSRGLGSFGAKRAAIPPDAVRMPPAAGALQSEWFTPRVLVLNQGGQGACTGFAFRVPLVTFGSAEVSPGGLYYWNRYESNPSWVNLDSGAYMQPSVEALMKYGAGSEVLHPYDLPFESRPSDAWMAQAADHRVEAFYRATTVHQIKTALSIGIPVVLSFDVPPGFDVVGETGYWNDTGGKALGGHAVCAVGYDDVEQAFLIQNSWGTGWGIPHPHDGRDAPEGFFWVPYEVIQGPRWWDGFVITTFDLEAGR